MPERPVVPSLNQLSGNERRLSGPALVELMRAILGKGRPFRFCARGWSMSPFVRDGDLITVAPLPPRGRTRAGVYDLGEIVAFVSPSNGRLVVHRIVGRHESRFLIQGDNLPNRAVATVERDGILGRIVQVERGRKRVWLGLGPERFAIALLSRVGLLIPARARVGALLRFLWNRRHDSATTAEAAGDREVR